MAGIVEPAVPAVFTGTRVERYWVDLLGPDDNIKGRLGTWRAATVEQNWDRRVRGGMKIDIADVSPAGTPDPISWLHDRFRPWIEVNGKRWPLGVYLPQSPKASYGYAEKTWSVACLDKTAILAEYHIERTYAVAEGSDAIAAVRQCILDVGEDRMTLTPSSKVTREPMVWPPGTDMLRVVNDLLEHVGYDFLWVDGYGTYRGQPHVPAAQRPVIVAFAEGAASIHHPAFERTHDVAAVPNRVVLTTAGTDESVGLLAVVENNDPNDPYSIPRRRRVVSRAYTGVEAADLETLTSLGKRYLTDARTPLAYLDVAHAALPLDLGHVVRFVDRGVDVRAYINEYTLDLTPGALMTGKWQEVQP